MKWVCFPHFYRRSVIAALCCMLSLIQRTSGSAGDRSWTYNKCLQRCRNDVCLQVTEDTFLANLPVPQRWLGWSCVDECRYACMWHTVENFHKDGSSVPKFHGTWPFVRLLGMQEPASAIFSLLNGLANLYMIIRFRNLVPRSAPMYKFWHFYAFVCMNTWTWSTIFHTKDTPFTEKMDYFCALSLTLFNLYLCLVRMTGTFPSWRPAVCALPLVSYFIYHVYYLGFVHFDYGFNMNVNIFFAATNAVLWMFWLHRVRRDLDYVNNAYISILMFAGFALLEILDFPPIWWTFDAHSLWHGSTIIIPFFWYRFGVDDCLHLLNEPDQRFPAGAKDLDSWGYSPKKDGLGVKPGSFKQA